jgi:sugar phosphate isomerase/epimerase
MAHRIHALDSFFYSSMGVYAFQTQCEMLAELGYNGITVAAWGGTPLTDLSLLPSVKKKHGLDVEALYLVLHEGRNDHLVREIVETVEGVELIELAIQTSVNGTAAILRVIESLLPIVERRNLKIALYPHLHHVTQTTSQVVAVCEHFGHSRLGASFNGYHWYASQEGKLEERLNAMKPSSRPAAPCPSWVGVGSRPWSLLTAAKWTTLRSSRHLIAWVTQAASACWVGITAVIFI